MQGVDGLVQMIMYQGQTPSNGDTLGTLVLIAPVLRASLLHPDLCDLPSLSQTDSGLYFLHLLPNSTSECLLSQPDDG